MLVIRDINFKIINQSENLRGILEYTRVHGVERVDIWPTKNGAQFGIRWNTGATLISDFADCKVCQNFFNSRNKFAPWIILHPLREEK